MKTIFDRTAREELTARIHTIGQNNTAQWGKMNLYQMIKHCTKWNDWVLGNGNHTYRQDFLGKLFGKMVLKGMVKDDKPMKRNSPAGSFTIKESGGDIERQKKIWLEQIAAYGNFSNPGFIHDFFGSMKREELGIFVYKHMDHHLRQFNA
ncbi:DUF1569 domain-containing protein [Chryseobacterium pennipullorum]|uniref:DUF1569 domain-containing protein n=1 Tax=Chryseobacterium pennipullorum TaxID=2258963 RepID=A0A3D9ATJ3_9FLAO|nr:DUF1569 domain-containing protein [Chryseobacterium pennipullorum]REC44664.1 hypothetical protein DRF67_17585 [Chryseobacterium pennipullorum]